MNKFSYNEIKKGYNYFFWQTITQDMMDKFLELSGDSNPLHCDEFYAREKHFDGKVVYGMLTSSLYSKLVGVYIPGERCVLQNITIDFIGPAYIGDNLKVIGTVKEKIDSVNVIIVKGEIRNQYNKIISRARMQVGVM